MTRTEELSLPETLIKTIAHFAPQFWAGLSKVRDFRNPALITYPAELELFGAILFLMLRVGSRRNIKYKFATAAFIDNLRCLWKEFYPGGLATMTGLFPDTLFHGDTLHYLLKGIDPADLHEHLRKPVIKRLLRNRCLEKFRLMDAWYVIAVDGTGYRSFDEPHCEHCLVRKLDSGTVYLHQVLEAKLVLPGLGMALSVGTEFIENEKPDVSKQDCEWKAFQRLAKRLKGDFPQLNICLSIDGLYLSKPMIDLCRKNRWHYMITFKEGSASALFAEYEALLTLTPENALRKTRRKAVANYRWINDIDWDDRVVHVLENLEQTGKEGKRFVWATDFRIDIKNVARLEQQGGRSRWVIENQGFNVQKNGGYGLEHAFSNDNTAMKNIYLLTQMAHIFNQLMEKGSLLRKHIETKLGSLKVFSERLWAALTETRIGPIRLRAILAQRIQIRFDTG